MNLQQVTAGFSTPPQQLLTVLISPGDQKYGNAPAGISFYDEVLRRARNVPGVEMAAISDSLPPDREGNADTFRIEGQTLAPGEINPVVTAVITSPYFFPALRIPLVRGRHFTDHDRQGSRPVAMISEGFARRFFPDQEAIGKRIREGREWMEIVGIVGNVKYRSLTFDTDAAYYLPFAQPYTRRMYLVVRSSEDAAHLAETLRRQIQSVDAGATLAQMATMEQALDQSVSRPRFNTMLLVLFAGIALMLAAIGIYGLIAYWVTQRTHEIGVRMALGAAQADVMRMVVRQGASLAAMGIVIGLGGAFALTRLLETMLFGLGVTDALTFAAAPLGILLVVLLATFIPAFRATRISPVIALRYE
jgi:putative ABC transport system permease protein